MHDEKHAGSPNYVLADLRLLAFDQGACQFGCCFKGLPNAQAVATRLAQSADPQETALSRPNDHPTNALRVGQTAHVRDVVLGTVATWTISRSSPADSTRRVLSPESPIAKALLGHVAGELVTVETPRGLRRLQIQEISQ